MGVRTVVGVLDARSAVGLESASMVVYALHARSAVGVQSASTVVGAIGARSAAGKTKTNNADGGANTDQIPSLIVLMATTPSYLSTSSEDTAVS